MTYIPSLYCLHHHLPGTGESQKKDCVTCPSHVDISSLESGLEDRDKNRGGASDRRSLGAFGLAY